MSEVTKQQRRELEDLVNRLCDNLLTKDELDRLDELLHDHTWAVEYYVEQLPLHARLTWCSGYPSLDDIAPTDCDLNEDEMLVIKRAVNTDSEKVDLQQNRSSALGKRALKNLLNLASSSGWRIAASVLVLSFFVVSIKSLVSRSSLPGIAIASPSPHPPSAVQATLTRYAGVEWEGAAFNPELGSRPGTQLMRVLSGRIQMTFDNGVEVVIEGPAEFSHDGFGGMTLSYGTLTAVVPGRVEQFSVYTSSAFVESEGNSEFGLIVKEDGQSEVHVLDGSVSAGILRDVDLVVAEYPFHSIPSGQALRIDRDSANVALISCDVERFTRISIQCLDVVDLVAGGNGYGDQLVFGIHALTGEQISPRQLPLGTLDSNASYNAVKWNQYVDGVFIPESLGKPVQIDSSGHSFSRFPEVTAKTWVGGIALHRTGHEQPIALGPRPDGGKGVCNWLQSRGSEEFAGLAGAFLGLHANCGLTLDLEQIEQIVPTGQLHHFHADLLHSRPPSPGRLMPVARPPVLWVFLDGKLHSSYRPSAPSKPVDIEVPFQAGQRFLTLVVTDGDGTISEDWMVLANPILKWVAHSSNSM